MASNKRNILQVVTKAPSWGFDLFRQIDIGFSDTKHNITTVFLHKAKGIRSNLDYQGNTIILDLNHRQPLWRIIATYKLFWLMRSLNIDTIMSHHYKPSSIMAFIERFLKVKQAFMINHNSGNLHRSGRKKIIRYLFSDRWKFITVSNWVRRDFLVSVPWLPDDRVQTIYNCIDIDAITNQQLNRNDARKKLGIPQYAFVFGNIDRLTSSKGHDYIIEAFSQVCKDSPYICLVIIGGGERKLLLENLANNFDISDKLILTGLVTGASQYIRAFDIYISSSLREGFGLGLCEGMATSIPVIVSDGGALPEVIGNAGFLFKAGSKDELASQMNRALKMSKSERVIAGQQCFDQVSNNFTPEKYHQHFLNLLSK